MKKLIFALIVVAALFVVAMPVAAQGPDPYIPVRGWYNRTSQMSATWTGDPFGGNPRLGIEVRYEPDGKGGVAAKYANASWPYAGIVAKFGPQPYGMDLLLPGGIPSSMSGDGSGPRKAIYIGGAWADASLNPVGSLCWSPIDQGPPYTKCRKENETPYEIPACATIKVPAGTSKWFKLDTWYKDNAGRALSTQIWVDDELDGATQPSGSAVFGAANKWFLGTAPFDGWSANAAGNASQDRNVVNGWVLEIYDPDVLQPNYAFAPPNAFIFTFNVSSSGSLSRGCTAAAYAGQPCVSAASGGNSDPAGNSVSVTGYHNFLQNRDQQYRVTAVPFFDPVTGLWNGVSGFEEWVSAKSTGVKGYANYNPNWPMHLLWAEGKWDGWVFLRLRNTMIWDGTASTCSYRAVLEKPATR